MEADVTGPDEYGNEAYRKVFDGVMNELEKGVAIDKVKMVLDPLTPLFILSVAMRSRPESKKIADAASIRAEGDEVHMTISDENYAPEILSALWKAYGRERVEQQTRFDIKISNADDEVIGAIEIASGEDAKKEMIGAMWRVLPEGIKARHNISEGRIITIAATEEIFTNELKEKAMAVHEEMRGSIDV